MKNLWIFYDPGCAFCRRCRRWLERQPAYLELNFVPARPAEAERIMPGVDRFIASGELTVVGDDGAVYQGASAFIMCLYALREFREWSQRLSRPSLLPFARQFFDFISNHRAVFSRWMRDGSDEALASHLAQSTSSACDDTTLECLAAAKRRASD